MGLVQRVLYNGGGTRSATIHTANVWRLTDRGLQMGKISSDVLHLPRGELCYVYVEIYAV